MNYAAARWGWALPLARALLAVSVATSLLVGCLMYMAEEFLPAQDIEQLAKPTESSAAQITLGWDPPSGTAPVAYKVYFRIHGQTDWVELAEIPATPSPEYTVAWDTLKNGEFDFGVLAVYDSDESEMHSSLDKTASPETGWYLKWQR